MANDDNVARDFFVGIDLGSYAFRAVAARPSGESPDGLEVFAGVSVPSAGIRRGTVIAADDIARALALLRGELEKQLSAAVGHAFVGVGGPHVASRVSRGLVVVSRADNRIGADDVRRVLEAAGALSYGQNIEVLHVIPREFIVDGERGMRDVEGLKGRRLEVEAVVLTGASPHLKGLRHALATSDIQDHECIVGSLATARSVLTPRQRELGVALVDIGHGTTDVGIFEDGQMLGASVLPIGGGHVTNDIAIGLRCSVDAAERAKHEYGVANAASVAKRDQFELAVNGDGDPATFSRRELAEIVDARLDEIFELVAQELKRMERWRLLPAGIVLTGGTANIPGIVDAARRAFKLPVQLGYPSVLAGPKDILSDFSYATALGLACSAFDKEGQKRKGLKLPGLPGRVKRGGGGGIRKFLSSLLP